MIPAPSLNACLQARHLAVAAAGAPAPAPAETGGPAPAPQALDGIDGIGAGAGAALRASLVSDACGTACMEWGICYLSGAHAACDAQAGGCLAECQAEAEATDWDG